ncbi:MAG: hypothetical protein AAB066_00745 [Candidatus Margulisiibacteriota bacterium]
MIRRCAGWALVLTLASCPALAQTLDENALFEDAATIATANSESIALYNTLQSVTFSGQIQNYGLISLDGDDHQFLSYADTDFFLDIRLNKGIKAFADFNVLAASREVVPGAGKTALGVKEFFVDIPMSDTLYLRTGKQFLSWGRTYFWKPVDFANQQQVDFFRPAAIREGVYGLRLHVSEQTDNVYLFFQTDDANRLTGIAFIGRYEWTVGHSELGLSSRVRYHQPTRYGFDFYTPAGGWDINTELSASYGTTRQRVTQNSGVATASVISREWVMQAAVNVGRSFDWERPDRITWTTELYYDSAGYAQNVLADPVIGPTIVALGYTPNHLSQWYAASFLTISEFPNHSTSLSSNILANLVDRSYVFSIGLTYTWIPAFKTGLLLSRLSGASTTEYGQSGTAYQILASAILTF